MSLCLMMSTGVDAQLYRRADFLGLCVNPFVFLSKSTETAKRHRETVLSLHPAYKAVVLTAKLRLVLSI